MSDRIVKKKNIYIRPAVIDYRSIDALQVKDLVEVWSPILTQF